MTDYQVQRRVRDRRERARAASELDRLLGVTPTYRKPVYWSECRFSSPGVMYSPKHDEYAIVDPTKQ